MSTDISREAAELLPCPFCGSTDLHETSNGVGNNFMECASCGCSGPPHARWNTRSDRATAALREENARLKEEKADRIKSMALIEARRNDYRQGVDRLKRVNAELRAECERLRQQLNSANQQHQLKAI